jgi:protein-arginine kinase activator protein McsA
MKAASIMVEEDAEPPAEVNTETREKVSPKQEFSGLSDEELKENLQAAVENEEYEKASRIRDELNHRNKPRK